MRKLGKHSFYFFFCAFFVSTFFSKVVFVLVLIALKFRVVAGWFKETPEKNINGRRSDMPRDEPLPN